MSSTVIAKNLQIGADGTASNNFTIYQPASPDGTLRIGNGNTGTTSAQVVLTSAGNVGIGTSSPNARLAFSNAVATNGFDANMIRFFDNGTSVYGMAVASSILGYRSDNHVFYTNANSPSERMRIDSAGTLILNQGQIQFPATQVPSSNANTLDDYEEGTWTPSGVASAGYTISLSNGAYTKIGRLVHVRFTVQFSAVGANNSAVIFGGLPFMPSDSNFGVVRDNTTTGAVYMLFARSGTDQVEINSMDGVAPGSQRTIRVNESYTGTVVYMV